MAHFDKLERPELQHTEYHISDDYSHTAQLTAEQAYDLLQWLYHQRDELHQLVYQTTRRQSGQSQKRDRRSTA